MIRTIFIVLFFVFSFQSDNEIQKTIDLAKKISSEFSDSIRTVLFKELSKGGYTNAIKACAEQAQQITRGYQEKYQIYIRRVSEKYRNELNKPDDYETKILSELSDLSKRGELAQEYYKIVEENGAKYLRYFRPLIVQPMCLNCHGKEESLKKEIREFLKERYPNDKAVGYQAGDFRGVISVKIKLMNSK